MYEGDSVLDFEVGTHPGFYSWRFPSREGLVSVGSPKGGEVPEDAVATGARHLPFGGVPETVSGNAMIVGDNVYFATWLAFRIGW